MVINDVARFTCCWLLLPVAGMAEAAAVAVSDLAKAASVECRRRAVVVHDRLPRSRLSDPRPYERPIRGGTVIWLPLKEAAQSRPFRSALNLTAIRLAS